MNQGSYKNHKMIPEPLPSGLIPTLNKMGYMTQFVDEYSQRFIDDAEHAKAPLLEIGAAYGIATLEALRKGAKVISNDLDEKHLKILEEICPSNIRQNLTLLPGKFPEEIDIQDNSISSILMCRVIHFFTPDEIALTFKKSFDMLVPGGKLYIVADTPYQKNWAKFLSIYEQKKRNGDKFPGLVTNSDDYVTDLGFNLPQMLNFMDDEILHRELTHSGFVIDKLEYINRLKYPDTVRLDGRESIGATAIKPFFK
jgi:ubiquinone/menaquinone biosynthesis C-methylase UbiE